MDHDAVIAFCEALQASTTLQELTISDVPSFGGFHGRTLPVSLKRFEWNMGDDEVVDDATLTDLATAVGPTQLQHLLCNGFGSLATRPAAAPMLSQLQSLVVYQIDPDTMEALIAGVASVPALTSLELAMNDESSTRTIEHLMASLATTCVHLQTLHISADALTRERLVLVLSGVLELPQLTSLHVSVCLFEVVHVLPELVAAELPLVLRALARVPDVPFVLQKPSRVDAFVGNALAPRSDPQHQCRLDTGIYR
ncbi:hypothetical protein SPRG_04321 [Saprolegnia parasitica CBS 223.65]|uniref:Uncharacterized protein n=1 Tax=Saprolegnia parasitica (strain CBS 223.65) TaxID=695850 RepID=A0A067CUD8_SAPPC|nr:hypothetical protein SPRG_04321 [Saprolegnia parasitica CBS 223.65]KDO30407.1 hypothetical protein SPRG_04321 [Saprolegnia parasitica CBS 223.65]|eukprot:XP_012198642.1 hypothetical protein SPRG_04321 [Saprolegnia parasitica CBS 223.65]